MKLNLRYDRRSATRLLPLLRSIAAEIQERTASVARLEERIRDLSQDRTTHRDEIKTLAREVQNQIQNLRRVVHELEELNCTIEPEEPLTFRIQGTTDRPHHAYRWRAGSYHVELAPVEMARSEKAA
jgi:chromosome segregation ATPase